MENENKEISIELLKTSPEKAKIDTSLNINNIQRALYSFRSKCNS